jgi:competence protein ComGC
MSHVDNNMLHRNNKGFTLIELLLAMTFISTLLLTIALTIVQIANIYNHGMILKEVNQTARAVTQELDRAVRASSSFSTEVTSQQYVNNAWGGRLCLGQYSYVWNYGKALSDVNPNRNFYSSINTAGNIIQNGVNTRSEIAFVKVLDPAGSYCVPNGSGGYPDVDPTNATELLRSGDHSLVLHAFNVTSTATAKDTLSAQQLYKFSFTLGTNDINALTSDQSQCKAPNVTGSDLNYCSVEQFTIVLRAVSGVN